jgi:hypothetical protein
MRRVMIRFGTFLLGLMVWLACAGTSQGFSLLGPIQDWQVEAIGYDLDGDIGGPVRPNEGYRWNLPVITYAVDQSFVNYFGIEGIRAIDQAMKVFNDLPPMNRIETDGFSFFVNGEIVPTRTTLVNPEAAELGLLDVKSIAMRMVIEELGLANPERFAWTLRGREVETDPNPDVTNYLVINLNFDPITLQPSPVVNGILYGYDIVEQEDPDIADAFEFAVDELDPLARTSVAGGSALFSASVNFLTGRLQFIGGRLFTGLTHDDVGGLRWLYRSSNFAVENLETNVVLGSPIGPRGSPWQPFFANTNLLAGGTNGGLFNTNALVREGLRGGINDIRFQRVNFDSLLGRIFVPFTNRYMDRVVTNGQIFVQPVERVITQPDIIFVAEDLGLDEDLAPFLTSRTPTTAWINNDAINGQDAETDGGPGVIEGPIIITFTDQLPAYFNESRPFFYGAGPTGPGRFPPDEEVHVRFFSWGSFTESPGSVIIYPQYGNITIQDLRRIAGGGGN